MNNFVIICIRFTLLIYLYIDLLRLPCRALLFYFCHVSIGFDSQIFIYFSLSWLSRSIGNTRRTLQCLYFDVEHGSAPAGVSLTCGLWLVTWPESSAKRAIGVSKCNGKLSISQVTNITQGSLRCMLAVKWKRGRFVSAFTSQLLSLALVVH